jgi:4-hydroxy-tetrahydrodipicolinate reductase
MEPIPVVVVGLGPIGRVCAEMAAERQALKVVGAVDVNPDLVGRELDDLTPGAPRNVVVTDDLAAALSQDAEGVALLTTSSSLAQAAASIKDILAGRWHVVTTCEEAAYPFRSQPELADELDRAARSAERVVLGTGVNPGLTMDALPSFVSGAMRRVEAVVVERFQDASTRRLPFQRKIGAGLNLAEFEAKVADGVIRHVGFRESVDMIAAAWGVDLDRYEERVRPVMATTLLASDYMNVLPGQSAGLNQIAQGFVGDRAVITLNLQAYFGHPDPKERVVLFGEPHLEMIMPGGVHGDVATGAMTVNAASSVVRGRPGFRSMLDVPLATAPFAREKTA